jgi:dephospho-CoA kinase
MTTRRIGIAGFMGAGKTTYARFLSVEAPQSVLIDADREAKSLMQNSPVIQKDLAAAFGELVAVEGVIDFRRLGKLVFSSGENIRTLNRIVHPHLLAKLKEKVFSDAAPSIICDAALIPLWHIEAWFDTVTWVRAAFDKRLERLKGKTSLSHDEVESRMNLQQALFTEPDSAPWHIVENNGTIDDLKIRMARSF